MRPLRGRRGCDRWPRATRTPRGTPARWPSGVGDVLGTEPVQRVELGPGLDAEQAAHQRLGQRSARRDEDRAVAEPAGVGEHELGSADRGAGQLLALAGERGPSQLDEHQDRGEATGQPQGERVDVTTRAVTAQVGCEERFGEREHHAEHEQPEAHTAIMADVHASAAALAMTEPRSSNGFRSGRSMPGRSMSEVYLRGATGGPSARSVEMGRAEGARHSRREALRPLP